jgi:hypothetical protein
MARYPPPTVHRSIRSAASSRTCTDVDGNQTPESGPPLHHRGSMMEVCHVHHGRTPPACVAPVTLCRSASGPAWSGRTVGMGTSAPVPPLSPAHTQAPRTPTQPPASSTSDASGPTARRTLEASTRQSGQRTARDWARAIHAIGTRSRQRRRAEHLVLEEGITHDQLLL